MQSRASQEGAVVFHPRVSLFRCEVGFSFIPSSGANEKVQEGHDSLRQRWEPSESARCFVFYWSPFFGLGLGSKHCRMEFHINIGYSTNILRLFLRNKVRRTTTEKEWNFIITFAVIQERQADTHLISKPWPAAYHESSASGPHRPQWPGRCGCRRWLASQPGCGRSW